MSGILEPIGPEQPLGSAAYVEDDTLVHRSGDERIHGAKEFIGPILVQDQDPEADDRMVVNIAIGDLRYQPKVDVPLYVDPATNPFNVITRLNEIRDALIHAGILAP